MRVWYLSNWRFFKRLEFECWECPEQIQPVTVSQSVLCVCSRCFFRKIEIELYDKAVQDWWVTQHVLKFGDGIKEKELKSWVILNWIWTLLKMKIPNRLSCEYVWWDFRYLKFGVDYWIAILKYKDTTEVHRGLSDSDSETSTSRSLGAFSASRVASVSSWMFPILLIFSKLYHWRSSPHNSTRLSCLHCIYCSLAENLWVIWIFWLQISNTGFLPWTRKYVASFLKKGKLWKKEGDWIDMRESSSWTWSMDVRRSVYTPIIFWWYDWELLKA